MSTLWLLMLGKHLGNLPVNSIEHGGAVSSGLRATVSDKKPVTAHHRLLWARPFSPHLLRRSLSSRGRRCREADPRPSGSPIVGQISAFPQTTPSFPHHIFMTLSSRPSLLQPCR